MEASANTQAILLLTTALTPRDRSALKPLTPKEWRAVWTWLEEQEQLPENLLLGRPAKILRSWTAQSPQVERIDALLGRGLQLALAMERWEGAGLWVMSYLDEDYPDMLKSRLPSTFPAAFFGCGNRMLLRCSGLSLVGSRNAPEADLKYAREFGSAAAQEGVAIVSGGARGVDEHAMRGALERGGDVVGILTDRLLKRSIQNTQRFLNGNNLALVSVTAPEVSLFRGAFVGAAMQRNDYIYGLSSAAVVVHSGEKGGTWSGATKNIKRNWVPLWVKHTRDGMAGNATLVQQGGRWLPDDMDPLGHVHLICKSARTSRSARMPTGTHASLKTQITQAVLLLTTRLIDDVDRRNAVSPMDFREWGSFASWLKGQGRTPADLANGPLDELLQGWDQSSASIARIKELLDGSRKNSLAQEEDAWREAGLWVMTRGDKDYPKALKDKLKSDCPAVLFGFGDRTLLSRRKLAAVGSRRAAKVDLDYAWGFGADAATKERVLVSTGTHRIGEEAIRGSLENGGVAVAVFAGNLLRMASNAPYRGFIEKGKLVLLSAVHPEAKAELAKSKFTRQLYEIVYCLSDAAVIIRSGLSDVVMSSAKANLKKNWTQLWVRMTTDEKAGNAKIVEIGGKWLPEGKDLLSHMQDDFSANGRSLRQERLQIGMQGRLF